MNFRLNDTRRFVTLSSLLLLSLKAVQWDFQVEKPLGTRAVPIWSYWSFHPFVIIRCIVNSERKILQTSQTRHVELKERHYTLLLPPPSFFPSPPPRSFFAGQTSDLPLGTVSTRSSSLRANSSKIVIETLSSIAPNKYAKKRVYSASWSYCNIIDFCVF